MAAFEMVWLGTEPPKSKVAIKSVKTGVLPEGNSQVFQAVQDFFHRTYWYRLWLAQEFIRAIDILLTCVEDTLWWEQLWTFHGQVSVAAEESCRRPTGLARELILHKLWWRTTAQSGDSSHYASSRNGRNRYYVHGSKALEEILLRFARNRCSDTRDKVYGLLGLLDGPLHTKMRLGLKVYYSQLVEEVYSNTMLGL